MKIPGHIVTDIFLAMILTTTMVLFITLPINHNNPKTIIELINNKD
jgi:hypothetical protein